MKKLMFFLVLLIILQGNNQALAKPALEFTDLTREHWAYNTIETMASRGYLLGYPDGSFKPEEKMTREEFTVLLVRCLGITPEQVPNSSFVDIPAGYWSINYVEAVKEYLPGYLSEDGQWFFKGAEPVTRQDVTAALVRAKKLAVDLEDKETAIEVLAEKFQDFEAIDPALQPLVAAAVEDKLISGFPDQTFRPEEPLTRAQASTILYRAFCRTDSAIKNLLEVGDITTLNVTEQLYNQLALQLNSEVSLAQIQGDAYSFKLYVKEVLQNIEQLENLIYVFANSDAPFSFEGAGKRCPEQVEEYIQEIKKLVLKLYPDRPLLVMVGYTKQDDQYWWMQAHGLFDGTDYEVINDEAAGIYRVDKFFAGALFVNGENIDRF